MIYNIKIEFEKEFNLFDLSKIQLFKYYEIL